MRLEVSRNNNQEEITSTVARGAIISALGGAGVCALTFGFLNIGSPALILEGAAAGGIVGAGCGLLVAKFR